MASGLDQILSELKGHDAESPLAQSRLMAQFKKLLAERMLSIELEQHLLQERQQAAENNPVNYLNCS